jgi:ectoine hydroxylase-related dioxygenase (phytanoyl-CoA dioxygenase family)
MAETLQFDITPTEEQLSAMERRFEFIPSGVENPRALTREQVEQFNRLGFVTGITVFNPQEIAAHRAYFDELLQRVLASGRDAYSISSAHLKYGPVYDILTNERIVSLVADLLGPDVIGWGSHYFCKLPGDEKEVDWHQDASYWPLSHTHAVTVWLAIDECDVENGCMQFIAGSHRMGHLLHDPSGGSATSVLGRGIKGIGDHGDVVDNPLRAGQVSIHSDLLVHGSAPNRSARRRCGLTLRYCTPDVRAELGWHRKGVVVRGVDPSGHWANPARPTAD